MGKYAEKVKREGSGVAYIDGKPVFEKGTSLPRGQVPNREGFAEPVYTGSESRLTQLMRAYARGNGGEWPYFGKERGND